MMANSRPVAIITGGTRGIGSGIAEAFAEQGYNLLLGFRENINAAEIFRNYLLEKYDRTKCGESDLAKMKIRLVSGSILEEAIIEKYFEVSCNFM